MYAVKIAVIPVHYSLEVRPLDYAEKPEKAEATNQSWNTLLQTTTTKRLLPSMYYANITHCSIYVFRARRRGSGRGFLVSLYPTGVM